MVKPLKPSRQIQQKRVRKQPTTVNWASFDDSHSLSRYGTLPQPLDADQRAQLEAATNEVKAREALKARNKYAEELRGSGEFLREAGLIPAPAGWQAKKSKVLSVREQKIWNVANLRLRGMAYCRELDREGLRPPWTDKGCPSSYAKAYVDRDKRWQNQIRVEKFRILEKGKALQALHETKV